ncbi:MAG: alpha/beta fold hydrolase [Microthrixaceae bacterium]
MLTATLLAGCAPAPGPGEKYRVPADFGEGLLTAMKDLYGPPAGANVPCKPSAEHPRPVILLHGFMGNMADNMNGLSPFLANQGYCVYALNYGEAEGSIFAGFADIRRSSLDEFGPFVDEVLAETGARQVDVVGHSEGSVMPRWWMRFGPSTNADGTPKVANFIGVAPASYGAELGGYAYELRAIPFFVDYLNNFVYNGCGACEQILAGSTFLNELNTESPQPGENFSGPTQPGVKYLMLATEWDNIVVSYKAGFIDDPQVTNMTLQDVCAIDRADHLSIVFDPTAYDLVTNFLSPDHKVTQRCAATEPVFAPLYQGSGD